MLNHPRAVLDKKRSKKIGDRLDDGFTEEELFLVPHGVKKSEWHMAGKYDTIACIYRDADQVEKFIELAKQPIAKEKRDTRQPRDERYFQKLLEQQ